MSYVPSASRSHSRPAIGPFGVRGRGREEAHPVPATGAAGSTAREAFAGDSCTSTVPRGDGGVALVVATRRRTTAGPGTAEEADRGLLPIGVVENSPSIVEVPAERGEPAAVRRSRLGRETDVPARQRRAGRTERGQRRRPDALDGWSGGGVLVSSDGAVNRGSRPSVDRGRRSSIRSARERGGGSVSCIRGVLAPRVGIRRSSRRRHRRRHSRMRDGGRGAGRVIVDCRERSVTPGIRSRICRAAFVNRCRSSRLGAGGAGHPLGAVLSCFFASVHTGSSMRSAVPVVVDHVRRTRDAGPGPGDGRCGERRPDQQEGTASTHYRTEGGGAL